MLDMLKQLALEAVKVYAILIGLYYGLGFALTSLNRYFPNFAAFASWREIIRVKET